MGLKLRKILKDDWIGVRQNFDKIKTHLLGPAATVSHADLTLTNLTASELLQTDANKKLTSIALPLIVAKGGTGATTLTDHGILLGSGTGAITPLGVASNGQIPIGSAGADPVLAGITGTTDHISVANGAGSITLNLDTNTRTLLGSFNGMFLEKIDFTVSEAGGTVTGSLEQDSGGDLIQKFSDGYTTLDCTPALTINLTGYVGTDAVPKKVFVYILQSAKTVMAASNSDWPATEHIRVANLLLKSAVTTGNDGGALINRNWNDFASAANGEGHISHVENRIRQEPTQWNSGIALTLKNSAGTALTTGNSSTAVEIVTTAGTAYQLHKHTFPAFDMYTTATDDVHIANQPTDEGGANETTVDLVTDITHYVDGTAAGVAIGTNKYFNLVMWGVQNRSGEPSHIMINLPIGQYTTSSAAVADIDGTSVFDIPAAFKGMGFLIARLTFRLIAGAQWTYIAQEDLRGQIPPISAGVSVTTTDHALLANLGFAIAGHTGFQAQGDVLDNLNTLGAPASNGQFIVATGAGAFAYESTTTARTSLGVGTGDSPQFTGITLTGNLIMSDGSEITQTGGTVFIFSDTDNYLSIPNYRVGLGVNAITTASRLAVYGSISLKEQAAADGDAGSYGQLWVKTATPNELWFTDDAGTDVQLGVGGADEKVKIDSGATAGYLGAANNDGVLRTSSPLIYTDGGNFVTLSLDAGLTNLATIAMAADKFYYTSADNTHVAATVTAFARTLLDDADAATARATLGGCFIDRGDPVSNDFVLANFITDSTWRDLDLSSIVPAGAKAVAINALARAPQSASTIFFRKNGNSNEANVGPLETQVANIWNRIDLFIACDANRIIEYKIDNVTWTNVRVTVKGWFL